MDFASTYSYALNSLEIKNLYKRGPIPASLLQELVDAAEPFLSGDVVDETTGTIILMDRLEQAIKEVKEAMANGRLY